MEFEVLAKKNQQLPVACITDGGLGGLMFLKT
jgi:hypothetical protein